MSLLKAVDYDYFGGKAKFDEIVRLAKEHASKLHSQLGYEQLLVLMTWQ